MEEKKKDITEEKKKDITEEKKVVKKEIVKKDEASKSKKKCSPGKVFAVIVGVLALFFLAILTTSIFVFFRYSDEIKPYFTELFTEQTSDSDEDSSQLVVTEEERNVISIVEENSPSVVSIAVSQLSFSQGQGLIDTSSNIGTGFIADENGIIVTNQHVVSDTESDYKVVTSEGDEYDVVDIVRDDVNDIAVIKIDATGLNAVELGDSENLSVGQSVIAIGTPLGEYSGTVTSGIISGLNRSVAASSDWFGSTAKTYEDVIQTDAAINPGNSGGPLINSQGEVIGINFATTSGADNISFAIPINKVTKRVDEYRSYGKFIKPYLGVSYQMISEYEALYYSDVVAGALIVRTDPFGPAYEAGVRKGDIVTEFNGESVTVSLSQMIQQHDVQEEVSLKVWRDGGDVDLNAILREAD